MTPENRTDLQDSGIAARALVTGLTGQDGYYLAAHLLRRGYHVIGGVHANEAELAQAIVRELGPIEIIFFDLNDEKSVEELIRQGRPDTIYHLAAQSSVAISWADPVGAAQTNAMGTLYLLEAARRYVPQAAFVMAGSCDCFDHEAAGAQGVTPSTPFKATNPYAVSKIMAHQLTQCYRDHFGLRASVAIFFNHTSPRRPEIFVERGIVRQAVRVSRGLAETVDVGSMDTRRDWSWAPDLMQAFAAMGEMEEPADLVLASGKTMSIGDWVREVFAQLGLDPERQVRIDPQRLHGGDRQHTFGNIKLAQEKLGWQPKTELPEMVRALIEAEGRNAEV